MTKADPPTRGIDLSVPHSARVWNYWLGGKDNFQVDRDAGDEALRINPGLRDKARACRHFLARTVGHLGGPCGVRQYLDIGTGLPTADNTHEVAQRVARDSRVVYVDNDPLVLAHARALLTSVPEGATSYIDADLRDPDTILTGARRTLDFTRPIALILFGVLGHIDDYDEARSIVRHLMARLPAGSYFVGCDGTISDEALAAAEQYEDSGGAAYHARTPAEITGFYDGLELVDPGVVPIHLWRPRATPFGAPRDVDEMGGIGRRTGA